MKHASLYALIALTRLFSDIPLFGMFFFLHAQQQGVGGSKDMVWNAIFFAAFGLLHSLLARNNARQQIAKLVGEDYVRTFYVIINGIFLSLLITLWRPVTGVLWKTEGLLYWILTILFLGCIAGMFYTASFIDYLDFLGIRSILRTIKNRPPKSSLFSARGPYAHCRHPMYLFLFFAFWIGPVMTYRRLEFALMGSIYLIIGTLFEERNLRHELREVYDLYRANVPMWIPRLRPWQVGTANHLDKEQENVT
jgi:protein-S-isoprenylcysteine O-methyltransferase Ste14